jgi:Uma2 family endonuclease
MLATEPKLVIEVLSPSTRGFDSHRKVLEYKSQPEIGYILLVDSINPCVLAHFRDGDGWGEIMYDKVDDIIEFPEIGASLALSDIYDGIEFKPRVVREPEPAGPVATLPKP